MRKILSLFPLAGMAGVANAHTLAADEGLPMQLLHQTLGLHHFAIIVILMVVGIGAVSSWYRKSVARGHYRTRD